VAALTAARLLLLLLLLWMVCASLTSCVLAHAVLSLQHLWTRQEQRRHHVALAALPCAYQTVLQTGSLWR
jgi:hypothetical protein